MKKCLDIYNSLSNESLPSGYITDGLVFQIDGVEDNGATPHDLINNIQFEVKIGSVYKSTDYPTGWRWVVAAIQSSETQSIVDELSYDNCTIEIVRKDWINAQGSSFVVIDFKNHKVSDNGAPIFKRLGYTSGSNEGIYEIGDYGASASNKFTSNVVSYGVTTTTSITNNVMIVNKEVGTNIGVSPTQLSYNGDKYITIGGIWDNSTSTSSYRYNGYLFAIRVYNRKLSKEEMLHNQNIDYNRFGI